MILVTDMKSSAHVSNRKNNNLILDKGPTEGLLSNKKICLSSHYNDANIYLFVNGVKIHKFKAKDCEINAAPLYLSYISKDHVQLDILLLVQILLSLIIVHS